MSRLGIFGGTFDPPHLAHLILADEAIYQLDLEKVLWVLTPISPLKPDKLISPWRIRLKLLESALANESSFEVSHVDIDRPPPHYAYETLKILSQKYPTYELVYLIGGDSLQDFPSWKKPEQILAFCDRIGVMPRPGGEINMDALNRELMEETGSRKFKIVKEFEDRLCFDFPQDIQERTELRRQETVMFLVEYTGTGNDLTPIDEEIDRVEFVNPAELFTRIFVRETKEYIQNVLDELPLH